MSVIVRKGKTGKTVGVLKATLKSGKIDGKYFGCLRVPDLILRGFDTLSFLLEFTVLFQ